MSRKPDFIVHVGRRDPHRKNYTQAVGVAWKNSAGGINLSLPHGVSIRGGDDMNIVLWPAEDRRVEPKPPTTYPGDEDDNYFDRDIPF